MNSSSLAIHKNPSAESIYMGLAEQKFPVILCFETPWEEIIPMRNMISKPIKVENIFSFHSRAGVGQSPTRKSIQNWGLESELNCHTQEQQSFIQTILKVFQI